MSVQHAELSLTLQHNVAQELHKARHHLLYSLHGCFINPKGSTFCSLCKRTMITLNPSGLGRSLFHGPSILCFLSCFVAYFFKNKVL